MFVKVRVVIYTNNHRKWSMLLSLPETQYEAKEAVSL
jgi:hypothetical protein